MHSFIRKSSLLTSALCLLATPAFAANFTVTSGGGTPVFRPSSLTIDPGDTVTFTNLSGPHNVVSNAGSFRCAAGCDGVGNGNGNVSATLWSSTVVFNTPGEFGYFCEHHGSPGSGMFGTVTVRGTAPPPPSNLSPGYTGAWYNPAQDGHGLFVEILPNNVMVAAWYVYGPEGGQSWIVGSGNISGSTATMNGTLATGSRFPPNFNASEVVRTSWGPLTFQFADCNNGRLFYNSTVTGYGAGSIPLTRLTLPAGSACAPGNGVAE